MGDFLSSLLGFAILIGFIMLVWNFPFWTIGGVAVLWLLKHGD
jgi:hypothetical protein